MKRTLIVMRHAKTEMQQFGQKDFDRNLQERGKKDAALIAKRLADHGFKPDLILTSSANRTEQTTAIVKASASFETIATQSLPQLYHATTGVIETAVMAVDDRVQTLMIVGHNPGISEFVYHCNPDVVVHDMPTSSVVVFNFNADNWQDFATAKKKIELYDYPKQ